jgi:hypothetical protein
VKPWLAGDGIVGSSGGVLGKPAWHKHLGHNPAGELAGISVPHSGQRVVMAISLPVIKANREKRDSLLL